LSDKPFIATLRHTPTLCELRLPIVVPEADSSDRVQTNSATATMMSSENQAVASDIFPSLCQGTDIPFRKSSTNADNQQRTNEFIEIVPDQFEFGGRKSIATLGIIVHHVEFEGIVTGRFPRIGGIALLSPDS